MTNRLYYGDNLQVLRDYIADASVDLIYLALPMASQPRIKELNAIFQSVSEVKQGDVIALDFLPGKGTQITMRGQVKDVIAGDDFARALLKVWLGKNPASSSLKSNLLGSK